VLATSPHDHILFLPPTAISGGRPSDQRKLYLEYQREMLESINRFSSFIFSKTLGILLKSLIKISRIEPLYNAAAG